MNWNPQQSDPYGNPYAQPSGPYQQPGGYQDSYGGYQDPYGGKSASSSLLWLWLLLGGMGVFFLLCCGAGCGLGYGGTEDEEQQLQAMIEDHPAVRAEVGNVQSVDRDWTASLAEEDDSTWYFNVKGDKGEAVIIIREAPFRWDSEELDVEWAKLRTESGEEIEIYP